MRLFVFGFGYSAHAVAARLRPRIEAAWGTTRDPGKLSDIEATGVVPILFDGNMARRVSPHPGPPPQGGREGASPPPLRERAREGGPPLLLSPTIEDTLATADHILVSIAPDEAGDPVLRHFREPLAAARPSSLVYLSTVGVYGDHDGAWVDEASECRPVSKRSKHRLQAEAEWQRFSEDIGMPVAILRLAGIYGPGRGPFEKIRRGTARRIVRPGQIFNRIHVEDIARIVEAAFARRANGIFNGSDDEPAPPQDVLEYAAGLLGLPPPPEVAYEEAELTPMARSFYGESKRVRNERIKTALGTRLAYPTYREGLAAILAAEGEGTDSV